MRTETASRVEHREGIGGLDPGDPEDRAGVDDRAAGAAVDHGDVGVAQDQDAGLALIPEPVDRRWHRLVGRDIFGIAGGRAVVDLDRAVGAVQLEARGQRPEEFPGLVAERGRLPPPQAHELPPLEGPAVMVASDAGDPTSHDQGHDGVGLAAVADQVARAEGLIDAKILEAAQGRLERTEVGVNVGDQSDAAWN